MAGEKKPVGPVAKPAAPMVGSPKSTCPACKASNDLGTVLCKKCGEILPAKGDGRRPKGGGEEFDATEGGFSPTCIIVPIILLALAGIFLFLAVRGGAKPGTCEHNQGKLGIAVGKYNRAHPESRMTVLDQDELMKGGKSGKPYLKEKVTCPVSPSAQYELAPDGVTVTCSNCTKRR